MEFSILNAEGAVIQSLPVPALQPEDIGRALALFRVSVAGVLDGTPYRGARLLTPGLHRFVRAGKNERVSCLWAPAFTRGYSPFHLRDRDF